jgi:hypothetical protein
MSAVTIGVKFKGETMMLTFGLRGARIWVCLGDKSWFNLRQFYGKSQVCVKNVANAGKKKAI